MSSSCSTVLSCWNSRPLISGDVWPLFEEAATGGDADAQYYIGVIYGEGRGVSSDIHKALFWLGCAGASDDRISMNARRLKARLLRGLPASQRADAGHTPTDCPSPVSQRQKSAGFSFFEGGKTSSAGSTLADGSTGFMGRLRENDVASLFLLPGDAAIVAARETASLAGAKQTCSSPGSPCTGLS